MHLYSEGPLLAFLLVAHHLLLYLASSYLRDLATVRQKCKHCSVENRRPILIYDMEKDTSVHTNLETDKLSGEPLEIFSMSETEFDQLALKK